MRISDWSSDVCSSDLAELRQLVELTGAPCTNTLMGLGALPASDDKFVGMPGMHGTYEANMSMQHCDVLIAVGARFDDRVIGNTKHFAQNRSEAHTSELQPLMRTSYAVCCLTKNTKT